MTRSGVRSAAGALRPSTSPVDSSGGQWRYTSPAVWAATRRRRVGIGRDTTVEWSGPGEYRGLHLPGHALRRHPWHWQLEVALSPDSLIVAGNGGWARFPTSEMILAGYDTHLQGAVRVDLVDGEFVRVKVRQPGELVGLLRAMIWDYDKQFLGVGPAPVTDEVVTIAEAIVDVGGSRSAPSVENDFQRQSEAEKELRLAVLRARRRQANGPG